MNNSQRPSVLETEHKKTSHNLTVGRGKTDESLHEARGKVDRRIDESVKAARNEADQITSSSRIEADTLRDNERDKVGYDIKDERKISDDRLLNERCAADKAMEQQRSQVDSAIVRERELKNALMSEFLEDERGQTDKNILSERDRTDSEVLYSSGLLSDEVAAHSKTKISLTTRDEFLAIVSHDLRNPIGTASSCAEMLLGDSTYKLDSEVKPWIELIKRNTDAALRLISDLLDMERISEGKFELNLDVHNIDKKIRDSVESFIFLASAKNVILRSLPSNISSDFVFDRDRIMQVLSNLIGNALKFTPAGGSIAVGATLSETGIQVFVRDTGPGIPEEKKNYIFDRFAQLGSKDRSGLGLGLYISKMFIEAHHGRLWVQSKVGEGSTFYFTIPKLEPKHKGSLH